MLYIVLKSFVLRSSGIRFGIDLTSSGFGISAYSIFLNNSFDLILSMFCRTFFIFSVELVFIHNVLKLEPKLPKYKSTLSIFISSKVHRVSVILWNKCDKFCTFDVSYINFLFKPVSAYDVFIKSFWIGFKNKNCCIIFIRTSA